MEKITLQPGVWTKVYASFCLQPKSSQSGIRIHFGQTAPAIDSDLYFVTQDYDLKPYLMPNPNFSGGTWLMPDEDVAVDVVTL